MPAFAHAATISITPSTSTVAVGDIVTVTVLINANGTAINNAEGTVTFPSDLLSVLSVSKDNSIFSLWLQDPTFSNGSGTVTFNGGVPNPGYSGEGGTAFTITFEAQHAGTATIGITNAGVLANDGLGTNVLSGTTGATLTLQSVVTSPAIPSAPSAGPAPVISSATNPDQSSWYPISQPQLSWTLPAGTTEVETVVSQDPNAPPVVTYTPPITQKTLDSLADGLWYFGVRADTANGWTSTARYALRIDTTIPNTDSLGVVYNTSSGTISISPAATDAISGVAYYLVSLDGAAPVRLSSEKVSANAASIPVATGGAHTAVIQVFDNAGNETQKRISFSVTRSPAPIIDSYTHTLSEGQQFVLSGTASQESSEVIVSEKQAGGEVTTYNLQPDSDGHFTFLSPIWSQGSYQVWVNSETTDGALSDDSTHLAVTITPAAVLRIGSFALTLPEFLALLLLLLIGTIGAEFIGWHRLDVFRKKMRIGITKTEKDLHHGVGLLKEELESHVEELKEESGRRRLTPTEELLLESLQTDILDLERFVRKDLDELKKK